MEKKLVSVIIPAYNAEKYLKECLDSVLNQSYEFVEIVAVNDGSVDRTGQILDSYAQRYDNVRVIHTENGGVCRARNTGLNAASGELVTFLDSDDLLAPDALKVLYTDLCESDADISCALLCSDAIGEIALGEREIWRGTAALEQSLLDNPFTYSSCAKLYKRSAVEGVRFVEGRKIHEDSFFIFECFLKKPTVVARSAYVYTYRSNPASASHAAFSDKFFDILYFAQKKAEAIDESFPELSDKAKNVVVKANLAMLECLVRAKGRKYRISARECIRSVKKYRKYFIPSYAGDTRRFKIAVYNLYGLYKLLHRIRYGK